MYFIMFSLADKVDITFLFPTLFLHFVGNLHIFVVAGPGRCNDNPVT